MLKNDTNEVQGEIEELEKKISQIGFWDDKLKAQEVIKRLSFLKSEILGLEKYDKGGAILSILSGAGGDDAEDFSAMLLRMYLKYIEKNGWQAKLLHENKNDNGGYRNISIEIIGKNVYGTLKNESGVHRLVRISPFNANAKRHTSFSLVEIIPKLKKNDPIIEIPSEDLKIEFSKSGGPGGQNVNKRETAVRVIYLPMNFSVRVSTERSQEQNRERAIEMIKGKLFKRREENRKREKEGLSISKTTEIEWGNQIRSYILHPYKLIKDHRTKIEVNDINDVLENGNLSKFIEAEKKL